MARGTTLEELVRMFRAESRQSLSAAAGQNTLESAKLLIRRVQEQLYEDFPWPHLRVRRDETLQAGQRYYSFPSDLNFDRVEEVWHQDNGDTGNWRPVKYGIGAEQFNAHDSDADSRSDPVRRWAAYEGDQYEVWPIPESNGGILRFTGIKQLARLTQNQDRADLDDHLIALFAAADWLAGQKSPLAKTVEVAAQAHYARLRGNSHRQLVTPLHVAKDRVVPAGVTVRAPGT